MGKQLHERLDATIGKFTGHHGEQRWKRECFGWRFDFGGERNRHTTDDQSGYPGCHGDVPVGKVHEEKASDVTQCSQKRTAQKVERVGLLMLAKPMQAIAAKHRR